MGIGSCLVALWGVLALSSASMGLTVEELYPFGSQQGDRRLAVEDDLSSPEFFLNTSIAFYDERFTSLYVNLNGFVSFETEIPAYRSNMIIPFGYKIIAPFFADIDIRLSGNVYYRETFDPSLKSKAAQDIGRAFPGKRHYPISLIIVTWDQVGYYESQYNPTNTFQLVMSSDAIDSFAIFLYPDNGINWIKGDGKESPRSEDPDAQAGFDAGDGRRYLTLPGSGNREVQNLPTWSNFGMNGVYVFHIGDTRGQNIETPSSSSRRGDLLVSDESLTCADGGQRSCHSNANCVDYLEGFCCECTAPYIGNGEECIRPDEPQRISGKVSGRLNGVSIDDVDLHAYVVTTDGRTYTAISRMEYALGQSLLSLYPIASVLGFLFALPQQPAAKNGFMIAGGDFNRTATVQYQPTRETVTIQQRFTDPDVPGHLRLATTLEGTIPRIADNAKVEIDDYKEEYRRVGPGVIKLSSAHNYRVDGVPYRFTVDETINFKECPARPLSDLASVRIAVSRNFIVYSEKEQIVRYSQTNKVSLPGVSEDPCQSANCDSNANCVPLQDTFRCVCKPGFEGTGQQCRDVDECRLNTDECHEFADCFNSEGSYQCRCQQGYTGDGRDCRQDIQPESCRVLGNCGQNADCVYDEFSRDYVCRCRGGFDGDGYSCHQVQQDDCTLDVDCDINANCVYDERSRRYECRCFDGYDGDGRTCRLAPRDCRREPGVCARNAQCAWDGTSYSCRCDSGYRGDGYQSCTATSVSSSSYLLYAQGMYIMEVPFSPSTTNPGKQTLYVPGQTAIGINVDCYSRYFYWTDVTGKTISRAKLDGTDSQVIVRNLGSPEGVAVDWISKNLYWTDSGSDRIEMSRLDGSNHKTLFSDGLVNPRGIAVDPIRGFLFWTDWNRDVPKVERSNMDGSERRTIVSDGLGLPNGLTLDYDSQLVCWSDAGTRKVECASYDGRNRRLVSQSAGYPFGLAYRNDVLYWTDWEKKDNLPNAVVLPPIRANEDLTLPSGANGRLYGITTVEDRCPPGSNPCALNNGGCRFLCLPVKGGRTCTCPDDIDPEECNRIALL